MQHDHSTGLLLWTAMFAMHGCGAAPKPTAAPPASRETAAVRSAAVGQICDIGDRIFVVDAPQHGNAAVASRESTTELAGSVVVISRSDGTRGEAPIDAGSVSTDECGGAGGGHPGCSERDGSIIHSRVLGADHLFFGNHRSLLVHGDTYRTCRDSDQEPWIALCATRTSFAVVGSSGDRAAIRIYRGRGVEGWEPEPPAVQENVQRAPDGRYVGKRATLAMDKGSGTLELDGEREPCLAVDQPRRAELGS